VWAVAVLAYAVAVLHRSSFGVAGVAAAERFGVGATVLSTFVVLQLAVYAAMQIPVGVLLDRFGSRALVAAGALLMATGQVMLGLTRDLPVALVARVLIGAGDAATWISVIRLVALWFPARHVPLVTQLTGMAGHLGQLASAVPLVAVLQARGWEQSFVGLGAVGVLAAVVVLGAVRDAPPGTTPPRSDGVRQTLREALRTPGTWLGFWSHALGQFPPTVFLLLWGYPFLLAQGLAPGEAGGLLGLAAVAAALLGPVIGVLTGRHPLRRSWMVLVLGGAVALAWAAVLLYPGPSPRWLLVVLVAVLGAAAPAAAIGFDFARTFNPANRLGTASGVVNVGGFSTAVVTVLAVGVVLDAVSGGGEWTLDAFRVAFAVQVVPWAAAVAGVLLSRRRTRAVMREAGVIVPPIRQALARHRALRAAKRASRRAAPPRKAGRIASGP
jgi:MFS family permease